MDDGMKSNEGLKVCTDSFQYSNILILTKMLKTKLNIDCKPQKKREVDCWRIYIPKSQMVIVRDLVKHQMHHDMLYKIGL